MGLDKSAMDLTLIGKRSIDDKYTGQNAYDIARELVSDWSISEKDLASRIGVSPGHHNSGVGDIKRLVRSILQLGWDYTDKNQRPDK